MKFVQKTMQVCFLKKLDKKNYILADVQSVLLAFDIVISIEFWCNNFLCFMLCLFCHLSRVVSYSKELYKLRMEKADLEEQLSALKKKK